MYATCLFCNRPLGSNEVIEEFPIGQRLSFDAEKGRLWVVCRKCERWNLSPIEERWEAIEACERFFRDTRKRVSTENIGLARHASGLELLRVGRPLRPEFAAWRYGDQFGRRRQRAILYGVGAATVIGGIAIGGAIAGVVSGGLLAQSGNFINAFINGRTRLKLPTADGRVLKLKLPDLMGARMIASESGAWYAPTQAPEENRSWSLAIGKGDKERIFYGEDASTVAGIIMPHVNRSGARTNTVQQAVQQIETMGGPDAFLRATIEEPSRVLDRSWAWKKAYAKGTATIVMIGNMPKPKKLALEMALHEEQERRALEGELKALELAWKAAEEVAAISDDLLLSDETRAQLARYRTT